MAGDPVMPTGRLRAHQVVPDTAPVWAICHQFDQSVAMQRWPPGWIDMRTASCRRDAAADRAATKVTCLVASTERPGAVLQGDDETLPPPAAPRDWRAGALKILSCSICCPGPGRTGVRR